jgi:hypothetical protein
MVLNENGASNRNVALKWGIEWELGIKIACVLRDESSENIENMLASIKVRR